VLENEETVPVRTSEWIQLSFALAFALLAWLRPIDLRRRARVALLFASVLIAIFVARNALPPRLSSIVRDWLPAALLLFPYWQVGQFFTGPDRGIEQKLVRLDNRVLETLLRRGCEAMDSAWAAFLELAYLMCYPLVPLGLAVLYLTHRRSDADFYWVVVVLASDICFLTTVFVPAMPPRALSGGPAMKISCSDVRKLNLEVLERGSIQAITFPSAHVASTTACALVLLRFVPYAGFLFLLIAITIALGAFLGRYHYLLDVISGAVVALAVFLGCLWLV
jgi:membrane-associated phospholipid phosphatase